MGDSSLARGLAYAAIAVILTAVLVAGAAGAAISSLLPGGGTIPIPIPIPGLDASIPAGMLGLYQQAAAATCPGMSWTVLAAIGTIESGNGTSNLPGVHSGANPAGAEVIYRWDPGLRHVSDGIVGRRASAVSASCEARGPANSGLTPSLGCPAHDGQLSGVACGVSF